MKTKTISARHALKIVLLTTILVNISTLVSMSIEVTREEVKKEPKKFGTILSKKLLKVVKEAGTFAEARKRITKEDVNEIAPNLSDADVTKLLKYSKQFTYYSSSRNAESKLIEYHIKKREKIIEEDNERSKLQKTYLGSNQEKTKLNSIKWHRIQIENMRKGRKNEEKKIKENVEKITAIFAKNEYPGKKYFYKLYEKLYNMK